MDVVSASTVIEKLKASLEAASAHNPSDAEKPAAILWTDLDSQWLPILPRLRGLLPHLLTFGDYEPEHRIGPSIWLRCIVDRTLGSPEISDEAAPIIYLPGVSRQELGTAHTCPGHLKPLVELQYRGTCWTQKNGRDWSVEAFLVSKDGGLGLDVARDTATRQSMLRALAELATASVQGLEGRRLEAEDFDRLFSDDPVRDVLVWLGDGGAMPADWDSARRSAFVSRCKADFGFDPEKDGELEAAERLGRREEIWESVWRRFAEAPALYPGIPELLRRSMPTDLFVEPLSSWPQTNEREETDLRGALLALKGEAPPAARERVIELEQRHGPRRDWVWAKLGQAPLADALMHLAGLAKRTANELGGASPVEMAKLYANGAWEADAAALSSMAAVKSNADMEAVSHALDALYQPWLEAAALHFQTLSNKAPLPDHQRQESDAVQIESGTAVLFADGLRFDVSQRLVKRLRARGDCSVDVSTRWAALPSVTATAKPAVSPVAESIKGCSLGGDFRPVTAEDERPLTTDRFRKLLEAAGFQYLASDETGDPSGRAWTEDGELDKLGHSLGGKLAARIDEQTGLLLERIEGLLDAGWREVRVVTDHGWLWLPGKLPKVDLPKYLTQSRWARCAAIQGSSNVSALKVPWYWNTGEQVAVAPGIACFAAGYEYAHGGLSLQESLIPTLRITAGSGAGPIRAGVSIAAVSWAGLRCRIRIDAPPPGLSVDLRTRINDPDSSVSEARPVDADGAASLLVDNDALEGTPAAVVVLDAGGEVIARQSTIIGGEG